SSIQNASAATWSHSATRARNAASRYQRLSSTVTAGANVERSHSAAANFGPVYMAADRSVTAMTRAMTVRDSHEGSSASSRFSPDFSRATTDDSESMRDADGVGVPTAGTGRVSADGASDIAEADGAAPG